MPKVYNHNVSYEPKKSEFDVKKQLGSGRAFYQSSQRFAYYSSPEKHGKLPSPGSYKLGDTFGLESLKPN